MKVSTRKFQHQLEETNIFSLISVCYRCQLYKGCMKPVVCTFTGNVSISDALSSTHLWTNKEKKHFFC